MLRTTLACVMAACCMSCNVQEGTVRTGFVCPTVESGVPLYAFAKTIVTDEKGTEAVVAETTVPVPCENQGTITIDDVPANRPVRVKIELRDQPSASSRVLFYGQSPEIQLSSENSKTVHFPIVLRKAPVLKQWVIENAVGPPECSDCYTASSVVKNKLVHEGGQLLEVANDAAFTVCLTTFPIEQNEVDDQLTCETPGSCVLADWDLDCGIEESANGPRSVYARVLDDAGYASETRSFQLILDTLGPTGGTLTSKDGNRLVKLSTTMLFGVLDADELYVEACNGNCEEDTDALAYGLSVCEHSDTHIITPNEWIPLVTSGCVGMADDSIQSLRVRYRDHAHNVTPWIAYHFDGVAELELNWMVIPGGTFDMGCSPGDGYCEDFEFPLHEVSVESFEMLSTEVTEEQYEAVTGIAPSPDCPKCPVRWVSWHSSRDFCEVVDGRLPTEAEWEYAARAGSTTPFSCGDSPSCLDSIGWHEGNAEGVQPVGQLAPNAFGLYDMLGNVWEWCGDWFASDYYCKGNEADTYGGDGWALCSPESEPPKDACVQPLGPTSGEAKVLRGGGAAEFNYINRVSRRTGTSPSFAYHNSGFRCARDL